MVNLSQDSIDEFRVRTALESALIQLDASWLILGDLRIDGPDDAAAADYAVLHPRHGVALIDVIRRRSGAPEQRLRKFLNERGFSTRFPGTLPIVRLIVTPCDAATLERQLRAAFVHVPPLSIADPDWMAAINSLLAPATAASTRPGFPLFRRPTPRRRAAAEPGAVPPHEEPWNVSPASSPRPAEPREQVPAAQHPAEGQVAAPTTGPTTGDAAETQARARSRRQPASSDEPTAGQQIQSLIELLRKNGVQKRVPTRPQQEQEDEERAAASPPSSAVRGTVSQDRVVPVERATPAAMRPAVGAPDDMSATAVAAASFIVPPPDSDSVAEPEEAEDDVLSSATTSTAETDRLVSDEGEMAPIVATPPTAGGDMIAAAADDTSPSASLDAFVDPAESEDEIPASLAAAAPMNDHGPVAAPVVAAEPEDRDPEDRDNDASVPVFSSSVAAPIVDRETTARLENGTPEDSADDPAPSMAAQPADAESSEARTDDIALPLVSSSIVIPTVSDHPEVADSRDTATAEDMAQTVFNRFRARPEDGLAAPVVPSSIDAAEAYRGLSARREDAISVPPPERVRWRSGATAAILLVALVGGATAWLRFGAVPNWLTPNISALSIVSALPSSTTAPPAAAPAPDLAPSAADSANVASTPIPPPAPAPAPKPAPASAPPATATAAAPPSPAPSAVWAPTATASTTPPKVDAPLPAAKPAVPVKRPAPRRAVPPRAVGGGNAPVADGEAAVAALPPESQGPPLDASQLPPLTSPVTPPAQPASADASASRLHAPTSLTPVWTRASAAAEAANGSSGEACHTYTATRTLLGQSRQVSGLACRDGNGQWQIISELPR